jgi:CHRD domain-containing protein
MKRFAILACAAALAAAGCGSSPTSPSGTTVFTVALSAQNETPPISNTESNARGQALITFHTTRDGSGNITAATVDFNVTMSGFPPNSQAILAHIHTGGAGVPGPVLVSTGITAGSAITIADGTGFFNITNISVAPDRATQILANPAGFYFNVHTPVNPGGAIRGQLQ